MIIRLASNKDIEYIFKIWHACFTDDQAYITNYLKYCVPHTKTWLLGLEKENFVSCLSVIPSYILMNFKQIRGGYLYAVGTLPEYRGNSYSKVLMESAIKDCKSEGLSYLLVKPANDNLYPFYLDSSFDRILFKSVSTFLTKESVGRNDSSLVITSLNASDLFSIREASFADTRYLWPKEILGYVIIEALSRSGSCKKFEITNGNSNRVLYYIAYPDELISTKIKVLETNAENPIEIEYLLSILKGEYPGMEETEIESPISYLESVSYTVQRSALLHPFNENLSPLLEKLHLSLPLE
ncbi:MAG: GNAT family N-acetyltransferase [Rikenellaceae bacterium]